MTRFAIAIFTIQHVVWYGSDTLTGNKGLSSSSAC